VPFNTEPNKHVSFRTMLLARCKKEFDTGYYQEMNYEKTHKCPDEHKKLKLIDSIKEKLSNAKQRSLGNIRFMGELFKLGLLTDGIMYDCIERLFTSCESEKEKVEYLCCLFTIIGKRIDTPNNELKMNNYFKKLENIAKNRKENISAYVYLVILDLIELRKNKWESSDIATNPEKTHIVQPKMAASSINSLNSCYLNYINFWLYNLGTAKNVITVNIF